MTQCLHQNSFSYKQPKGVPYKFDPEKKAQFIEEYKELKASLTAAEACLHSHAGAMGTRKVVYTFCVGRIRLSSVAR